MSAFWRNVLQLLRLSRSAILFVLALIALFGYANKALAANQKEAWDQCKAYEAASLAALPTAYDGTGVYKCMWVNNAIHSGCSTIYNQYGCYYTKSRPSLAVKMYPITAAYTCPNPPETWNKEQGQCMLTPAQACAALKADTENPASPNYNDPANERVGTATPECKGGCEWAPAPGSGARVVVTMNGAAFGTKVHYGFTGATCGTTQPAYTEQQAVAKQTIENPPTEPLCTPAGAGQTFCMKQNGEQCYTASTGRQICWNPNETGTKTTENVAQVRCPGNGPCTAPTPPPGETMQANGSPVTTVNTTSVNNTTTNTATTTTNNYVTVNGTNAGADDDGEPQGTATGSGDGAGSAGGVGQCTAPPTCSGNAVDCAVYIEAHNSACSGKKLSDVFTTNMSASEAAAAQGNDASPANADAAGVTSSVVTDGADLNDAGFLVGARVCPTIPAVDMGEWGTIAIPQDRICDWLAIGAGLVMAAAGLLSLRIIAGGA